MYNYNIYIYIYIYIKYHIFINTYKIIKIIQVFRWIIPIYPLLTYMYI